jgi:hypothetical protein
MAERGVDVHHSETWGPPEYEIRYAAETRARVELGKVIAPQGASSHPSVSLDEARQAYREATATAEKLCQAHGRAADRMQAAEGKQARYQHVDDEVAKHEAEQILGDTREGLSYGLRTVLGRPIAARLFRWHQSGWTTR